MFTSSTGLFCIDLMKNEHPVQPEINAAVLQEIMAAVETYAS